MALDIKEFTLQLMVEYVCRMVGHTPPFQDAFGSTDPAVQQMIMAVNVGLGQLLTMKEWQDLTVRDSILVSSDFVGQKEKGFNLPADFYRFIDQTQWGQQTMLPAMGPVSAQAWMGYTVRNWSPQLTLFWQMRGDQIWFLNPPDINPPFVGITFEYMYLSKAQVIDPDPDLATLETLYKNVVTKNNDKFKLDGAMITLLARALWLEWKGFDSSAAQRDFNAVFDSRAGADKGSPVLSLVRNYGLPYISPITSLPDTGYGS